LNIEELKKSGLYDAPIKIDNNQFKKLIPYSQYVKNFLCEEQKELKSFNEKYSLFKLSWQSIVDRKMEKHENLNKFAFLDIRAKDGKLTEKLIEDGVLSVAGVDMVEDWVNYAKSKNRPVTYCEDFTQLPFDSNTFDIVYSYKTFGRVKDNRLFLDEMCRITRAYLFLVIDEISRDRNIQYATTTDIRFYKQWLEIREDVIELTMVRNPVTQNPNEVLFIIYKHKKN